MYKDKMFEILEKLLEVYTDARNSVFQEEADELLKAIALIAPLVAENMSIDD